MFRSKTLFVVGAGASKEVGLPIGAELKVQIAKKANIQFSDGITQSTGDRVIGQALRVLSAGKGQQEYNHYFAAMRALHEGMPLSESIDNFLDAHREDEKIVLCGKLAITQSILESERKSLLYIDPSSDRLHELDFTQTSSTWYAAFFRIAAEAIEKGSVERIFDNVSFVAFNYDRCVEQFLLGALQAYYRLNEQTAVKIVSRVNIVHPYGVVGWLPWYARQPSSHFGNSSHNAAKLVEVASQVRTFTERVTDESSLQLIRDQVSNAETIVFLGFSFHAQNMELLSPAEAGSCKRVFATVLGTSSPDKNAIAADVTACLRRSDISIELGDLTCAQLFSEYGRSLRRL